MSIRIMGRHHNKKPRCYPGLCDFAALCVFALGSSCEKLPRKGAKDRKDAKQND